MKKLDLIYGNELRTFIIEGECIVGNSSVLLDHDDDLTLGTNFSKEGFCIFDFLTVKEFEKLRHGVTSIVKESLGIRESNFSLEKYHQYVDDERHTKMTGILKDCLPINLFPIDHQIVISRVNSILGFETCLVNTRSDEIKPVFCLRIVRPGRRDNNPLHRDVWLDRYICSNFRIQ